MVPLLDKYPSGGRIVRGGAPLQITVGVRNVLEVSQHLVSLGQILWYVRWQHLLLDKSALSGISGGLSLDHVVWTNRPSLLQVLKLVPGLERGGSALVELFDHPTRLIEAF